MTLPDTRLSLLTRLCDRQDAGAWVEFCTVYEQAVYNIARRRGLQDADAREVSQEVLLAVSRRVHQFDPSKQGRFRAWLTTIARNATVDQLRKNAARSRAAGDEPTSQLIDQATLDSQLFDRESQQEQFRWAANEVRKQVSAQAWEAFWKTAVEGLPANKVASDLGMTVGALYVARSRVLAKIKRLVEPFREDVK